MSTGARRALIALTADVAAVIVFAAAGRRSHDEDGNPLTGALTVAAPFLIALGVGWLAARAWRQPWSMSTGATLWGVTIVLGMVLRRAVFDRGTATSFVVVATLVTGALLLGWRVVARRASSGS